MIGFAAFALIALTATALALTRSNPYHAVLYLVVSLLAVAAIFGLLGAPFIAALEVIVYAGAIVVLFVFMAMLVPPSADRLREEHARLIRPSLWAGPGVLAGALVGELVIMLLSPPHRSRVESMSPSAIGAALFGTYAAGVEVASFMLLAALIGATHLVRRKELS
jgi:NADH-quinone oxidoreductase subunit J